MPTILFYTSLTLYIFICIFLILLVLIQKGRGGGLSSAFGGAGGNTAFGTKTGDVLTWATSVVFAIFVFLAVALNWASEYQINHPAGTTPAAITTSVPSTPTTPSNPAGH
jgi:preprotein translocase subunit SecG